MNIKLNEQISAVLSDLKTSLQKPGENVIVGGVLISREEAQKMCTEFEKSLYSGKNPEWNIIPLSLVIANVNYRKIQQNLSEDFLNDKYITTYIDNKNYKNPYKNTDNLDR